MKNMEFFIRARFVLFPGTLVLYAHALTGRTDEG